MTACVIEGKQCTACCQAPTISIKGLIEASRNKKEQNRWRKYVNLDFDFIHQHWERISRRRAKKRNPYKVAHNDALLKKNKKRAGSYFQYFRCRLVTPTGCSDYENRPQICSGFPRYNDFTDKLWNDYVANNTPEYHPQCTEHVAVIIPSVEMP